MKNHASMNRIYRLVWNAAMGLWVAVAENAKGRSKGGSSRSRVAFASVGCDGTLALKASCQAALALLISCSVGIAPVRAADAANAAVVAGTGSVRTAGNTTTINQGTSRLAIDWISLSTRANEALVFNQPSAQAIALNRITGTSPSELLGSLTANGQVFILNPNGVLFGAGSQVNVGGLVASTLNMSNADFMAGHNVFTGNGSRASVVNQGTLTAANDGSRGGYLALLAPEVRNEGVMTASLGTALLAAGNKVTLNLDNGSLLGYSIDQGAVNALAENKQLIKADGGQVLLSAKAMDALTTATVNNTGVIEARTIQNKAGRILLIGDMKTGTVNVGGTLDASAPNGGDGGFIEASAAHFKIAPGAKVNALAAQGKAGTWLIDPITVAIAGGAGTAIDTIYENTIEAASSNILIRATDTITASGTFGAADVVVPSGLNLTIQTNATGGGAGIDLTGSAHGTALTFKTSGGGSISMSVGNTGQTIKPSNLDVSGSGAITLDSLGPVNLSGVTVKTAGGAITLRGAGTSLAEGVLILDSFVNAGTGDVTISGSTTSGGHGVRVDAGFGATGRDRIKGNNISLTGTTTYPNYYYGVYLDAININASGNLTLSNVTGINRNVTLIAGTNAGNTLRLNGIKANTQASDNLTLQGNTFVSQSGSYSANILSIKTANGIGSSTTALQTTANQLALQSTASGGIYDINTGNVTVAAASTGGDVVLGTASSMTVGTVGALVGVTSTGAVNLETTGAASNLTLNQAVASTATGNAVVLKAGSSNAAGVATGGQFVNAVGTSGISAVNGRYLVYSGDPSTTTEGSTGYSKRYNANASFGPAGTASTFVYRIAPTITVTANAGTKVYDGIAPTLAYGTTGLIDGDTVSTALSGSLVRTGGKNVLGGDAVTVGTLADVLGYGVTYVGANYAISQAPLTVTASAASKTYGQSVNPSAFTSTGLVNSETIGSVSEASMGSAATANVGSYAITVGGATGGSFNASNYAISYVNGVVTINAAPLTVTGLSSTSRTYNGSAADALTGTATLNGLVNGETLTLGNTNSGTLASANAGSQGVTTSVSIANGTGLASNYSLTQTTLANVNIAPKALTYTATATNKPYDGNTTAAAAIGGLTGLVGSETVSAMAGATFNSKDVLTANLVTVNSVALADGTNAGLASNYVIVAGGTAAANITPKALTVTANDDSRVAGSTPYVGGNGVTYNGFVPGESEAVLKGVVTFGGTSQGVTAAGSFTIAPGGLTASNYSLGFTSGALNINAAPVSIDTKSVLAVALGSNGSGLVKAYDGVLQGVGGLGSVPGGGAGGGAGGAGAGGAASDGTGAGEALGARINPDDGDQ